MIVLGIIFTLPGKASSASASDSELIARMERIEAMLIAMGGPDMREAPPHGFHTRALTHEAALGSLSSHTERRLASWRVMDAISDFSRRFEDYIGEVLRMASNLVYVGAMALGFAVLPTPIMLLLAAVGIFGPLALCLTAGWVLTALGSASTTTLFLIGPKLAALLLSLFSLCFMLAATMPELAIFLMWIGALFSSRLFQHAALSFNLDLNHDGTVGWRDVWVFVLGRCDEPSQYTHTHTTHELTHALTLAHFY